MSRDILGTQWPSGLCGFRVTTETGRQGQYGKFHSRHKSSWHLIQRLGRNFLTLSALGPTQSPLVPATFLALFFLRVTLRVEAHGSIYLCAPTET